jgi:hypothetical protein
VRRVARFATLHGSLHCTVRYIARFGSFDIYTEDNSRRFTSKIKPFEKTYSYFCHPADRWQTHRSPQEGSWLYTETTSNRYPDSPKTSWSLGAWTIFAQSGRFKPTGSILEAASGDQDDDLNGKILAGARPKERMLAT